MLRVLVKATKPIAINYYKKVYKECQNVSRII
jgi:hypothetical protein